MKRFVRLFALACVFILAMQPMGSVSSRGQAEGAPAAATELISVAWNGAPANHNSGRASISADGHYVAFWSDASNLVSGDANNTTDVFVRDRISGTTELVSLADDESQGTDYSWWPSISGDGRYVAFWSYAPNLVPGDTNRTADIFVRDRISGTTERVSVTSGGGQANSYSMTPSISADGRYVAFWSFAGNLVPKDTNATWDIFVYDRVSRTTERVSVDSNGTQANGDSAEPSISADGRYVAFNSVASNLVSGDSGPIVDIFVHDRETGITERVSLGMDGQLANEGSYTPSISADGRYVAFWSYASNLVSEDDNGQPDIFVSDRLSGTTEMISVTSNGAYSDFASVYPAISGDGRYVAYQTDWPGQTPEDTNLVLDIYVKDRVSGMLVRASVTGDGTEWEGPAGDAYLSADGRYVTFSSRAIDPAIDDPYAFEDVYVRDLYDAFPSVGTIIDLENPVYLPLIVR